MCFTSTMGANATYSSTVINKLMECLSGASEKQLKTNLHQFAFIDVGIDESTDRAIEKHLALKEARELRW